ncbi:MULTISPECIES: non-hydrolyzing UDP-N-acetylglucosamine 2-epimerase [Actinomycetes]|uniref:UDP-N-acetylglucosamine 2-epimerase (non-hydrolyzing) n=5 Tax=Actinomycetes TaxID=1760 RepID=A0A3Q9NSY9_BREAU|nr:MULTISPECIES: UDP-N-acetylglucosamine 2-epimerase (non-hydrolyzing) [Actinomycetes]MDN5586069.1 UDP-N-acetylglucosamine 2-epimerase (non-hydrolyzing) [Brevibacterium sp.]MDN6400904.1 UDP-N-acetylglucosamine 2-epimerase (non-hydrolyzing) [Brachybacterium sp.]AHI20885.1 putative UDP-N-acetylglucosamine 2-epimerase [Corynebacterium casei LMG S-19264]AZT94280.1 UDP-N-acetylglucosamine 2-epimerase (non-hydrolyzing) [Brevibacterium aurantiacum]KAB1946023.1 UDP-N-acetylglucosamine 2-epimerase (non
MKTIGIILGTRPEAVKFAPLIHALREDSRFHLRVISTGQHREMLTHTLGEFGITPDVNFDIMEPGQSLTDVTHRALARFSATSALDGLDVALVHGDTATTLAGALAAFQAEVPIVHVEAGLRSGVATSPFPEEGNRKLVAQMAALHLAPTHGNFANLIREGVPEKNIVITGNTVVDALHWGMENVTGYGDPLLDDLDDDPRRVIVASAHHRVSHGAPMQEIADALADIANRHDVRIVIPVHPNPAVRNVIVPALEGRDNIDLVEPLPYLAFCKLLQRSDIIVSDSSGAEEEGPALGIPTLVLRDVTERHESLATGAARLVSRSRPQIIAEVERLLNDEEAYSSMANAIYPYGDGQATARSIEAIADFLEVPKARKDAMAHRSTLRRPVLTA